MIIALAYSQFTIFIHEFNSCIKGVASCFNFCCYSKYLRESRQNQAMFLAHGFRGFTSL